jgi:hypothetical protein
MKAILEYMNKWPILVLLALFGVCATVQAQDAEIVLAQADSLSEVENYTEAIILLEKNIKPLQRWNAIEMQWVVTTLKVPGDMITSDLLKELDWFDLYDYEYNKKIRLRSGCKTKIK